VEWIAAVAKGLFSVGLATIRHLRLWWRLRPLAADYAVWRKESDHSEEGELVTITVKGNRLAIDMTLRNGSAAAEMPVDGRTMTGHVRYIHTQANGQLAWGTWDLSVVSRDLLIVDTTFTDAATGRTVISPYRWVRVDA
jgi:hypothetical protein